MPPLPRLRQKLRLPKRSGGEVATGTEGTADGDLRGWFGWRNRKGSKLDAARVMTYDGHVGVASRG